MAAARTLIITVSGTGEAFELAVLDGMEPAALAQAVAARAGCRHACSFFLTAGARGAPLMPLSAALPDRTELVLHHVALKPDPPGPSVDSAGPTFRECVATEAGAAPNETEGGGAVPLLARRAAGAPLPAAASMSIEAPQTKVEKQLDGLERLNRLSTDLANERTLLAWVRTALAAIRTVFTYLSLTGKSTGWHAFLLATEIAMATQVVVTAGTGTWRYFRLKAILGQKVPPRDFGRRTLRPFATLVMATAVATATAIYFQQWEHD